MFLNANQLFATIDLLSRFLPVAGPPGRPQRIRYFDKVVLDFSNVNIWGIGIVKAKRVN